MATYAATVSVHETLTATEVDAVTLTTPSSGAGAGEPSVTVMNRTGSAEIYFTIGATQTHPADPTTGGANTFVVPAKVGATARIPVFPGVMAHGVMVKLISSGAEAYSVEAI